MLQRLHGLGSYLALPSISGVDPLISLPIYRPVGKERERKNQGNGSFSTDPTSALHRDVNSEPWEFPVDSKREWGTGLDAYPRVWPPQLSIVANMKQNLYTTEQALKFMGWLGLI